MLFSFDGQRIIYPWDMLRSFPYSKWEMCSDVFIFENSNSHEAYVLAILKGDNVDGNEYSNFTLDILSFIEIDVREIAEPELLSPGVEKTWINLIGEFDEKYPCGPPTSDLFLNCPQYKI